MSSRTIPAWPAPVLGTRELAEVFSVTTRSARRLLDEPDVAKNVFVLRGRRFILAKDLERVLAARRGKGGPLRTVRAKGGAA